MLSPGEAWLEGARVHPDHRRRGIGSLLNRAGLDWAASRGARVARLATEEENSGARRGRVDGLPAHLHLGLRRARTDAAQPLAATGLQPAPSADIDAAWMSGSPETGAGPAER